MAGAPGKPSLGLLITAKPKGQAPGEEPELPPEEADGPTMAARAFRKAAQGNDDAAMLDAFRALLEFVDSEGDEDEAAAEEPPMMPPEM